MCSARAKADVSRSLQTKPAAGSWDIAADDQMTGEEHEALRLEHRTWQLVRAVYE
jgi:hypothetical protein